MSKLSLIIQRNTLPGKEKSFDNDLCHALGPCIDYTLYRFYCLRSKTIKSENRGH